MQTVHSGLKFEDVMVQAHHKGFPARAIGSKVSELRGSLRLADGDFPTPVLLLDEGAMHHNIGALQALCDESGMSLSPHVKTTMSPEIIAAQLAGGAWAVTVATVVQARAMRDVGAPRVLIANEVVDTAAATWLGEQLDGDAEFTAYCYVDSEAGVSALQESLAARGQRRPLPVIVELGVQGGRTGLRTVEDVARLADVVRRSRHLRLAGVGGFEGIIGGRLEPDVLDEVEQFLLTMRRAADELLATGVPEDGEDFIVTAGGSAYFEIVRDAFDAQWRGSRPIRVVLRSGCYVAHDSIAMQNYRDLMAHRCEPLELRSALELWGRVVSRPEPDLALLDFGKRDTATDAGAPQPRHVLRRGSTAVDKPPEATVTALNDQHAYLRTASPDVPLDLEVGDLVGFGISHACTTFDKWRLIPIVDSDRRMVGAAQTLF